MSQWWRTQVPIVNNNARRWYLLKRIGNGHTTCRLGVFQAWERRWQHLLWRYWIKPICLGHVSSRYFFCHNQAQSIFNSTSNDYWYLQATANEVIYFWHSAPYTVLPIGKVPKCKTDGNYDESTISTRSMQEVSTLKQLWIPILLETFDITNQVQELLLLNLLAVHFYIKFSINLLLLVHQPRLKNIFCTCEQSWRKLV